MDPTLMLLMTLIGGTAASGGDFMGKPGQFDQVSTLTPEQQSGFNSLLSQLGGAQGEGLDFIQRLLSGDEQAFADFEAPFKRQFEQETIPGISERFAGMGTGGSTSSSGLNQSLSQAGRELTEQLAALRGGLQQNALSQLQGFLSQAYSPKVENVYQQPTAGLFGGLAQGAAQGVGQSFGLNALKSMGVG